jgi:hypothetical protein
MKVHAHVPLLVRDWTEDCTLPNGNPTAAAPTFCPHYGFELCHSSNAQQLVPFVSSTYDK